MTDSERHEILSRAVAGDLTREESEHLLAECRRDPGLRAQLARMVTVERLLHAVGSDPRGELAAREAVARLQHQRVPVLPPGVIVRAVEAAHRLLWFRRLMWAGAAAAVAVAALSGAWGWRAYQERPVAQITREEGVRWKGGAEPPAVLRAGTRLCARRGLFELRFANGANVVIEAPADLDLESSSSAFLRAGRAVAHVPKQARGFTLDSPRGKLVDLGTEFGVAVSADGNTEVHVLTGIVEASLNQSTPVRLHETEGLRATRGTTERLSADEGAFVTTLPPVSKTPVGYIHWGFDTGEGGAFANTGKQLGGGRDTTVYSRFLQSTGSAGPALRPGKFGKALVFDGVNDYAESAFQGITGERPRTIAFWVKVPRDFRTNQGYGIISWGDFWQEGAAWQISANPTATDGDLGRLRVGTKSGYVIGTTDLRDDQWHHCAVVMYGGPRPTTGTHVLLYVDGQIEPCPRKSLQEISTKPSAAHGVWMGRNLAFHNDAMPPVTTGQFFRGSVDEVYIFDGALSHDDIETLMRENVPPGEP